MKFNGDATLYRELRFTSCVMSSRERERGILSFVDVNLKRFCITAKMASLQTIVIESRGNVGV